MRDITNYKSVTVCLVLICVLLFSAQSVMSEESKNDLCLDCHDGYQEPMQFTGHRMDTDSRVSVSCIDCHSVYKDHIEDPSVSNILNPANLTGDESVEKCGTCHTAHSGFDNFGYDLHDLSRMNCSSCHKVHSSNPKLLLDRSADFCLDCHSSTKTDFMKRSSHPVADNTLSCLSCHSFSKQTDDMFSYANGGVCADCHPEQSGPFLHEHGAAIAYSVDESGCIDCHNPHGSTNDRLLIQPKKDLCRTCHVIPIHETAHTGLYRNIDCTVCHTGTHGSYESNLLLDPDLPSKFGRNCYESGCHSLNK